MSNIPYYFALPDVGIRKGIIEAHEELSKDNKTIYEQPPFKIPLYKSFLYRKNIEYFLTQTVYSMETFTEIERLKKIESQFNKTTLWRTFDIYRKIAVTLFGLYKVFNVKKEWIHKHKLLYLPFIPYSELKTRFLWVVGTVCIWKITNIVPDIIICLYYPSLLCDLQIGTDFEIGYWTSKFVHSL